MNNAEILNGMHSLKPMFLSYFVPAVIAVEEQDWSEALRLWTKYTNNEFPTADSRTTLRGGYAMRILRALEEKAK